MSRAVSNVPPSGTSKPKEMRCYRCDGVGHMARDCGPEKRRRGGRGAGQARRAVRVSDESSRHVHSCDKCLGLYSHLHKYNHKDHEQRPYQCPYPNCEWFVGAGSEEQSRTVPLMLEPPKAPAPPAQPTPEPRDPLVGPPVDAAPAEEETCPKGFSSFSELRDHLHAYLTKQFAWSERTVLNRRSMVQRAETWLVSKKVESEVLRTQVIQAVIDTVDIKNALESAVTTAAQSEEWRNQHIAANRAAAGWLYVPPKPAGWTRLEKVLVSIVLAFSCVTVVTLLGPGAMASAAGWLFSQVVTGTASLNMTILLANVAILLWRGGQGGGPQPATPTEVFRAGTMGLG
ncbi:hypothetical protein 1 [Beihai tombus-like virus 8]|uniref:hypothetical protein 1 n=1 Tax=Beihai tombus-like virus 8 TaxID=1922729 RepID=UPI00090B1B36|nr:hypothetical protein 1 [Beihai tombus-like virus 8]APG76204.1 hypothetical protein 1 [Beihai tombus-like virus 8]